jgi:hypothetical protein
MKKIDIAFMKKAIIIFNKEMITKCYKKKF